MKKREKIKFVFFGTPELATFALDELEKRGLLPSLVVTAPDRRAGRGMKMTPPPVKVWAEKRGVPVIQPEKLDSKFIELLPVLTGRTSPISQTSFRSGQTSPRPADSLRSDLAPRNDLPHTRSDLSRGYQLFIVAAYGKIIPKEVLDIPKYGTLNVHPSLLPKYRGPSPLESAILAGDEESGVSIMLLDEEMDHGNIVAQERMKIDDMNKAKLGEKLFRMGGQTLADIIPKWIAGEITPQEQEHERATYTERIRKEDGRISLADDGETNWRKFRAYEGWPGTFFFSPDGSRVKITGAKYKDGKFIITRVIPEGKKEVDYKKLTT